MISVFKEKSAFIEIYPLVELILIVKSFAGTLVGLFIVLLNSLTKGF